jgi:hypothetical protein
MKSASVALAGFDFGGNQAAPAGLGAGVNEDAALKVARKIALGFDTLMMINGAF